MNTQELLQQLRDKEWTDAEIGYALGVDVSTVYRWRVGQTVPGSAGPVNDALRRLLRRQGPPGRRRKDLARVS